MMIKIKGSFYLQMQHDFTKIPTLTLSRAQRNVHRVTSEGHQELHAIPGTTKETMVKDCFF